MVRDLLVSCSLQLKWSNIVKWAHRFLSFFPMVDHVCLLFLSCSLVPFSWSNHRQTQVAAPLSCDLSLDSNLITPVLPLRPNEYVPTFKSFGTISSPVRCHYTIVLMFKVIFLHHHLSIYPTFLWWWCMVTIVGRHSNTLLIPFLELLLLYDTNCLSFTSFNTQPFGLSLVFRPRPTSSCSMTLAQIEATSELENEFSLPLPYLWWGWRSTCRLARYGHKIELCLLTWARLFVRHIRQCLKDNVTWNHDLGQIYVDAQILCMLMVAPFFFLNWLHLLLLVMAILIARTLAQSPLFK